MKSQVLSIFALLAALVALSAIILAVPAQTASDTFLMSAHPSTSETWPLGPIAQYTVGLSSIGGWSGKVALTCHTNSPDVRCSVSPSSVEVNRELAVSVQVTATPGGKAKGAYAISIAGSSGDGASKSTAVTLIVR
jgi:hypothetical protein